MAGAPRTTRLRIDSATSRQRVYSRTRSSTGKSVWSSRRRRSASQRMGVIIQAGPRPRAAGTTCPGRPPPRTRAMEDGGMESLSARSSITARLARPSSGAAVTRTRSVPACQPTIALALALGCTRTWSSPSRVGRLGILGVRLEILLEQALVHLHGGAQAFRELAPHAPERLDLRMQIALRLARGVDDAIGLRLGLADDDPRLAARVLFHLLHEPLRGHERLLEHLLALLQTPDR